MNRQLRQILTVLALLIAAAGCGRQPVAAPTADAPGEPAPAVNSPPAIDPLYPVVRLDTSLGPIMLRLDADRAPGTVRNFLNYVNEGFYDGTLVHYVDADKLIVAGGYTADRSAKPPRSSIRNEAHNGLRNVRGTVAMARDASLIDSATSQFFINLTDAPQRDHAGESAADYGYCVFGQVIEGLDVAARISRSATNDLGGDLVQTPDPPVVISTARVIR
jgi:cyclophilin family peptidyl-prolyl cis-trans isomerase